MHSLNRAQPREARGLRVALSVLLNGIAGGGSTGRSVAARSREQLQEEEEEVHHCIRAARRVRSGGLPRDGGPIPTLRP